MPDNDWGESGLGSDDCQATHMLICDRQAQTMSIAPWGEGHQFLQAQHPPMPPIPRLTPAELAELMVQVQFESGSNFSRRGMFEFMLPPNPVLVAQRQALVNFLDQNLDPEIKIIIQHLMRTHS